jgi:rRNA maturation protein Rpf1
VLSETRGQPDGLIVSHLPFGPTAYFTLTNCVLRHDIPECTPSSEGLNENLSILYYNMMYGRKT